MKIIISIIIGLCIVVTSPPYAYALGDAIIAIVNDDVITFKELRDHLSTVYVQLASSNKSKEEIQAQIHEYEKKGLEKLIERKLLVDEAERQGITVADWAIEERLQEVRDHYGSDTVFRQTLSADGLTITDLLNSITDQIKTQSVIDMVIRSKIVVNPQEITTYYQERRQDFLRPERVALQSIFIPYENSDKAAAHQKADMAMVLLNEQNADFDAVMRQYSQAPSLGTIARGECLPNIEKVVFELTAGKISQPIETDAGIYIFKVNAHHPREQLSLAEVREDINNILFRQKFSERVDAWLKKLKEEAYIEIKG